MNIFARLAQGLFGVEPPTVTIDAEYRLRRNGNPFAREVRVKVKDVKDGWVLYAMHPYGSGQAFQNESMDLQSFVGVYERIL